MKIGEAKQVYSAQIAAYRQYKAKLSKQKEELEEKISATPNGQELFASEAATLELTISALDEKQSEYEDYMSQLSDWYTAKADSLVAKQQGEAMADYSAEMGKLMEVARRLMRGATVPPSDERKLMEFSQELYQAAKSAGALAEARKKEKYDSLWEDEEKKEYEDPMEAADNTEVYAQGPEIVDVQTTVSEFISEEE